MAIESYCGLVCSKCTYREKHSCPTCRPAEGKMFWGTCKPATCCIERKLDHCGQCADFPCAELKDYSLDDKTGKYDGRIENLRRESGPGVSR